MKKVLKTLGYMLLGAWTLFGIFLIVNSYKLFDTVGLIFLIGVFILPYIIILSVWFSRKRTQIQQARLMASFQSVSNADSPYLFQGKALENTGILGFWNRRNR